MRFLSVPILVAAVTPLAGAQQPVQHAMHAMPAAASPALHVTVDSVHSLLILRAGPFDVEPMGEDMHMQDAGLSFRLPVDGWLHGYRVDLVDAANQPLPRADIHHVGLVNLNRRELLYPQLERMLAAGAETEGIDLPATVGLPISSDDSLLFFAGLHSANGKSVSAAYVQITLKWTPRRSHAPLAVLPFYADVNNHVGGTSAFDLPPGRTTRSSEFTMPLSGGLIAVGGHMHPYGKSLTLQDAETGKTLVRLATDLGPNGEVKKLSRFVFGYNQDALRLEAGHRYRIIAAYDNTSGKTLPMGGMASMAGPFVPDDYAQWPKLDLTNPDIQRDITSLALGN
jgi:hypothetical protein